MDKGTQVPITSYKWVNLAGGSFNIGMNLADTEEDRAFPDPNLNSEDLVRGTLNEDLSPKRDTSARHLQEGRSPHSPTCPSPVVPEVPEAAEPRTFESPGVGQN